MLTRKVDWGFNDLFDILWEINTLESHEEMIEVIRPVAESGSGQAMARLGKAYRYGKGVSMNMRFAIKWLSSATRAGVNWAKNELFDIMNSDTSEITEESISIATELAESGEVIAMKYLSRAYRNGKGVEKDLDKAIIWIRKAIKADSGSKIDLYVTLRLRGNTEDFFELEGFANKGDSIAARNLSLMYFDGKGVDSDLDKAARWMKKAIDGGGMEWTRNELFDILWEIDTKKSHEEMIDIIMPLVESGEGNAMGRLGRAYRDGKGVDKNLNEAVKCMRKATVKNSVWNIELNEILEGDKILISLDR